MVDAVKLYNLGKEIGPTTAAHLLYSCPKTTDLMEKLSALPPNDTRTRITQSLKSMIKGRNDILDSMEASLTPELSTRLIKLATDHPEQLEKMVQQIPNIKSPQQLDDALKKAENPTPSQPAPPAAPAGTPPKQQSGPAATPPAATKTTPPSSTPPAETKTAPGPTSTPPAAKVPPGEEALAILAEIAGRPGYQAFLDNLQNNHSELADALGLGKNSNDAAARDPARLAALLPTLRTIKEDSDPNKNPNYFKDLSDQLDMAKKESPQIYSHIVDTAKEHPEKLGDEIKSAQNQFNMISGITDMGNKIGAYFGFPQLGNMLAGFFKFLAGIPIIGPMITGLLGNTVGALMGSGQSGDLQGVSNCDFKLAGDIVPGTVRDADNKRTYKLQGTAADGRLTDGEMTALKKALAESPDDKNDEVIFDARTKETTVVTTTKFDLPKQG